MRGHLVPVDRAALSDAYARLGNVHLAAAEVGLSHSVAHRRLTGWGLMQPKNLVTDAERQVIVAYYRDTPDAEFNAAAFAASIGRPEVTVSRVASAAGLTTRKRKKPPHFCAQMSARQKLAIATKGHPRGFLGGSHSEATRRLIGEKSHATWEIHKATGTGLMTPKMRQMLSDRLSKRQAERGGESNYSRVAHGRRPDIGEMYFRSSWEANYARYLNWLVSLGEIDGWEFEPETFWFEAIKRGVRSYKPDFRIREKGKTYYVEVKGWMDDKSKTKLRRMAKYHPTVEVRLVDQKQYAAIARSVSRLIPGWETRATAASVRGAAR